MRHPKPWPPFRAIVLVSTLFSTLAAGGCAAILGLDEFVDAETTGTGAGGAASGTTGAGAHGGASSSGSMGGADQGEPPSMPSLRKPSNGAGVGSMLAPGSRRPLFTWSASTSSKGQEVEYELEYSADPGFADAVSLKLKDTSYQPVMDLDGSLVPPVGRRYYWRVRACATDVCSAYSPPRHIEVGRPRCDFNADGYDDVAIAEGGAVHVFFGGPSASLDTQPDGLLEGDAMAAGFGSTAACAGDVDGDGFSDILVGAPDAQNQRGWVYIYRGGPGTTFSGNNLGPLLSGQAELDTYGKTVSGAGDINGDGYSDILVGAPAAGNEDGRAYVYFGSAQGINAAPAGIVAGEMAHSSQLGMALGSAGDLNGDGLMDVVVGQPLFSGAEGGKVFIYFGGPGQTFDVNPDVTLTGPPNAFFGMALGMGDVNGDGATDLLVGTGSIAQVWVYFGGNGSFDATVDLVVQGPVGDAYGDTIASADLDGDGYFEMVVGAPWEAGKVYIYSGGPAGMLDTDPDLLLIPSDPNAGFGTALGTSSDLNHDGNPELVIGAPSANKVYLYDEPTAANATPNATISGANFFGKAITR